jgi:ubiquinone/menaquinone biosynthesis C-methylase UbiE
MVREKSENSWLAKKRRERGRRALVRQLDYQEKKRTQIKGQEHIIFLNMLKRANSLHQRLNAIQQIKNTDKILEVGSGAHGLIFGFRNNLSIGIDPLAVDYKKLFPYWQKDTKTLAAIGEKLPFADGEFDIVLSDNVIDHAEKPISIIEEFSRVLKSGGLLYFTVNVHHPIYQIASNMHGLWNALGIKFELSPFADHTIHFTETRVLQVFDSLPFDIIEQYSTIDELKKNNRLSNSTGIEGRLKKLFFKNALLEIIAFRK